MTVELPENIEIFVDGLISIQPGPTSIWLIGSRANGRATAQSDTDLIVFGSKELLEAVRLWCFDQPDGVDCLIVYNGDDYQDPWQEKTGSLKNLHWQLLDDHNASYIGTKWVPDEESSLEFNADFGDIVKCQERAIKLWPKRI